MKDHWGQTSVRVARATMPMNWGNRGRVGPRWRGLVDGASVEMEVTREGVAWGGGGHRF